MIARSRSTSTFEGTVDHMSVAEAVKADALVDMVRSTDGTNINDLWSLKDADPSAWPVK